MKKTFTRMFKSLDLALLNGIPKWKLSPSWLYSLLSFILFISLHVQAQVTIEGSATTYTSISAALAAAQSGDVILLSENITDGELDITKPITINGNGYTVTRAAGYGIYINSDNVDIKNITITGSSYQGILTNCGKHHLKLTNVTVQNSGKSGININGSNNAILTNVKSKNNIGTGISITDSQNLTIDGVETSGNAFSTGFDSGIGIFSNGACATTAGVTPGISGLTIKGDVVISESTPIYQQGTNITLPTVTGTYHYIIGKGANDQTYVKTLADAYALAESFLTATTPVSPTLVYVQEITTGNTYVKAPVSTATPSLLIQTAIDFAAAGKKVIVEAGTYIENITINKEIALEGPNHLINGNANSRVAEATIKNGFIKINNSATVSLSGFRILQEATDAAIDVVQLMGNATIENNIFERNGLAVGIFARAITVSNTATTKIISNNLFKGDISGGLFSGHKTWNNGIYANAGSSSILQIKNNTFNNLRTALNIDDMSASTTVENNIFDNNGTQIGFGGTVPTEGSFTLAPNEFKTPGSAIINLSNVNDNFRLSISSSTYNGKPFSQYTLSEILHETGIEIRMFHRDRSNRKGLVTYVDNHQYVREENNIKIQTAVQYASPGHIINIAEGTFKEMIKINTPVTLLGNTAESTIIETQPSQGAFSVGVYSHDVTLKRLTVTRFKGNSETEWQNSPLLMGIITEDKNNLLIDSVIVKGNRNGIYLKNTTGTIVRNSNIFDNSTGFQIFGQLDNLQIINNKITNNFSHGIVVNFFQQMTSTTGLIVKDNYLVGNWFSQINMQSATPGANVGSMAGMDISCNWFGGIPTYSTEVIAAPAYSNQTPLQFGGTNTNTNPAYSVGGLSADYLTFSSYLETDSDPIQFGYQPTSGCISKIHNTTQSKNYVNISQAARAANSGDEILIDAGTYTDPLIINKSLTLKGANADVCAVDGTRQAETILIAPANSTEGVIKLVGAVAVNLQGFTFDGAGIAYITDADQELKITNSIFDLDFVTSQNNLYFSSNLLTLECNNFKAIGGNNTIGNSSHIFFSGNGLKAENNKFSSLAARSSLTASTGSLPVWLNISTNANNTVIQKNIFDKIDIGILIASNAGNLLIENNEFKEAQRQSIAFGNGLGSGISFYGNLTPTAPITITKNKFINSETGIRTTGSGTEFPASALLAINYNSFENISDKAIHIGSTYAGSTNKLNALCNWFDHITGPNTTVNNGGGGAQILDGAARVSFKNWLIYADADPSTIGFQTPASINVTPGNNTSVAQNHFRLLSNAIGCAISNQTITLDGQFDFGNAIAREEWKKGNDGIDQNQGAAPLNGTTDDYTITAPENTNNVTLTATSLGATSIVGPGDIGETAFESFLNFFSRTTNSNFHNWTISNLTIKNFDISVGAFTVGGSNTAMSGFKFTNNEIHIPADLNNTAEINQSYANLGLHINYGHDQEITNNKFVVDGTGISNGNNHSTSIVLQSTTSGDNRYDGLQISKNSIHVIGIPNADPARIIGIWDNSASLGANVTFSENSFVNDDPGNLPENNKQLAFRVTSYSGSGKEIVYEKNEISGFHRGIEWIGDPYTTFGPRPFNAQHNPVIVRNNKFNNVKLGITVHKAAASTNSGTAAIISNNSFTNIVEGGFAITNTGIGSLDAKCNWFDASLVSTIINGGTGGIQIIPKLSNGNDDLAQLGFQLDGSNTCIGPVFNVTRNLDYLTIQAAITGANANDEIRIATGIYPENVVIDKPLTIYGVDSSLVIIDKGNYSASAGAGISLSANNINLSKVTVKNFENGIKTGTAISDVIVDAVNANENFANGFFGNRTVTNLTIKNSNLNNNGFKNGTQSASDFKRGIMFQWENNTINNLIIENNTANANGLVGIDVSTLIPINGLAINNNTAKNNFDSQIAASLGNNSLTSAPVTITNNTVVVSKTARFGIEVKNPLGTGAATGLGSILVLNNNISVENHLGTARDLAGIIVMRRKDNYATINDQPQGVQVVNNTISNFQNTAGDAFGIVFGGTGHYADGNTITNTKYAIQLQKGNQNFNSNVNSGNSVDEYFERDNSNDVCVEFGNNNISGSGAARLVTSTSTSTIELPQIRVTNTNLLTKFCTIQQGIDFLATTNGHTLEAISGIYPEHVNINKSLTILGPNKDISGDGTRGTEAIIVPASHDLNSGSIIAIHANNVTIKGFEISGSNDALTSPVLLNGQKSSAAYGISGSGLINGLTIANNVIKNITKHGIDLVANDNGIAKNNIINNNWFDNIPRYNTTSGYYGRAILLANNFYANVTNNLFTRVERGIQTNNFHKVLDSGTWEISNNNIQSYRIGAMLNLHYGVASDLTFSNNTIAKETEARIIDSGEDNLPDSKFIGIEVFSIGANASVLVQGGSVTNADYGVYAWNNDTSNPVTIDGLAFTNNEVAILQSNYSRYGNAYDSQLNVKNVNIDEGDAKIAFQAEDHTSTDHAKSLINLVSGNSIGAGATLLHPFYLKGGPNARINVSGTNVSLLNRSAVTFENTGVAAEPNFGIGDNFVINLNGNDIRALEIPQNTILEILGNFTAPHMGTINPILINGSIRFTNGILNSGNGSIEFGETASDISTGTYTETPTSYILGKSFMATRNVGTNAIDMLGVKMAAGTNVGNLSILRTTSTNGGINPSFTNSASIGTVWEITPSIPSASRADVKFRYVNSALNLNSQNPAQIYAFRFNAATSKWEKKSAEQASVLEGNIYTTGSFGIAEFSSWTLSSIQPGPDLLAISSVSSTVFNKPSSLTRTAAIKLYNMGAPESVITGTINVYVYLGNNNFSLDLVSNPNWTITHNADFNYYTLTRNNANIEYGIPGAETIDLNVTAKQSASSGKSNINIQVDCPADQNLDNNSRSIELTINEA